MYSVPKSNKYCVVFGCSNAYRNTTGLSFFRFPKDPARYTYSKIALAYIHCVSKKTASIIF